MSRFVREIQQYNANVAARATEVSALHEAGDITDFRAAVDLAFDDETARFEAVIEQATKRALWSGLTTFVLGIVIGIVLGVATDEVWVFFIVASLGGFIFYRVLPAPLDVPTTTARARIIYLAQLKAEDDAFSERLANTERELELKLAHAVREEAEALEAIVAPARRSLQAWQQLHPAPAVQPYGVSAAGAEAWVRDWMVFMGAEGAAVTQFVGDGGIDVESAHHIAQVKHYTGTVGVGEIREHIGVAAVDDDRRQPLFFTSGAYAAGSTDAADRAQMPIFIYQVETGIVTPANSHAELLISVGLNPSWLVDAR